MSDNLFQSEVFAEQLRTVTVPDGTETVLEGQRRFDLVGQAFSRIEGPVCIMGYQSQGPAHANNLRSSFREAGVDVPVWVALREGSPRRALAERDGFTEENGTLVTPERGLSNAGFMAMLIADGAMANEGEAYLRMMRPGSVLGLAHGFYIGYQEAKGRSIQDLTPQLSGVIGNCPKGMGPSVKKLYEMGSGINSSFTVELGDDRTRDLALAWGVGIGAPYLFQTTLGMEWRSDLFGERSVLLGGVHGIVKAAYLWKTQQGLGGERAYIESVETLVGPISKTISNEGLVGVFERLSSNKDREEFAIAYNATYPVLRKLMEKIYADVSSGREILEVVEDYNSNSPKPQLDGEKMWRDGEKVRASMTEGRRQEIEIDAVVAGIYVAAMMAQVDVLRDRGHHWSEIVNESIVEAVDSLNPFMAKQGISFMVDNCSDTAQRGSRKWFGFFESWLSSSVFPVIEGGRIKHSDKPGMLQHDDTDYFTDFLNHPVHQALETFAKMRPPISIAL